MKLLLVEDNPADEILLRRRLCTLGADIDAVTTLREARGKLDQNKYTAVIFDLHLPDASPKGLSPILQSYAEKLPVIVWTGVQDNVIALALTRAGVTDVISKDCEPPEEVAMRVLLAVERFERFAGLRRIIDAQTTLGRMVADQAEQTACALRIVAATTPRVARGG